MLQPPEPCAFHGASGGYERRWESDKLGTAGVVPVSKSLM